VLLGTIASLGIGKPLFSARSLTVTSSHGLSPGFRYCNLVVAATITGPTAYWNRIKSADPPKATSNPVKISNCKKKTMANTKSPKMKADRNIEVAIANFSWERLAKHVPRVVFQH